ncbi:MAG: 16S rRNA (uracil(1498)-N(3))-methyltransferase [Nitrospirae bacterium]|nr:16S rRNA (uracil(1498)-N(3))-methyltransferase [Nitrospirota bacterium]
MNIILFNETDYYQNRDAIRLSDHRFDHISEVLRSKKNDLLQVGLINGKLGTGKVIEITKQFIDISVTLDKDPPLPASLTLLLALPRPKILKRTLRHVTTLGVKKIFLINSFRVDKSYWQTPVLGREKIRDIFLNSLEQSCDTILPELSLKPLFKPFVEDELPDIIKNTIPVLAHPKAANKLVDTSGKHFTLAVGPEGGFIPYEINKLKECGFEEYNFGKRILPVETAVPGIISILTM